MSWKNAQGKTQPGTKPPESYRGKWTDENGDVHNDKTGDAKTVIVKKGGLGGGSGLGSGSGLGGGSGVGSGAGTGTKVNPSGTGEGTYRDLGNDAVEFLKQALARAGDPSVTSLSNEPGGGMNPAGPFDCSSLVAVSLKSMGINAPRTSEEQQKWAVPISGGTLQPGDLIFEKGIGSQPPGHVVIYLGQGLVMAADEGGPVSIRKFNQASEGVMSYGRPPGLNWEPGATGAQTYLKQVDEMALKVGSTGAIQIPLAGIKLPTIGAAPKLPPKALVNLGDGQYGIRNQTVASKYSAFETLQNYLSIYFTNLSRPEMHALTDWAYQKTVTNGEDYDQTLVALRQTPWYAKVFPGNVDRMKQGQPLLTEAEYRSLEDNLRGQAANAGLPSGFIEKWIPKFIASNVSPTVVSQRLASALQLAGTTDVKVRQEFQRMFGVKGGIGAIAAYFIDPKHASGLIAQQANAAEYGALSAQSGLGELSRAQAMNLSASRVEKVYGTGAIRSAIQDSAFYKNLTGAAPGSNESTVTAGQLLGSRLTGFDANQAKDAAAVRNAESARESQTQAGGGFAPNATGLTGVGHASDEGVGRA